MNFEPIHVPYRYNEQDSTEQKVIFALGQLGEGTSDEIIMKLQQANVDETITETEAAEILRNLYDQGLIKGEDHQGQLSYNLSKIEKSNTGRTDINGLEDVL